MPGRSHNPYKNRRQTADFSVTRDALPARAFLYTMDQIQDMLGFDRTRMANAMFFQGRSSGVQPPQKMLAVNVAAPEEPAEWRVEEDEVVRWMRYKGIRLYRYELENLDFEMD